MFTEEEIKKAYGYVKEDDDAFIESLECEYHDPFDKKKFAFMGTAVSDKKTYNRFSPDEIDAIYPISKNVAWLATHSAGIELHFKTDSRLVRVRTTLTNVNDMTNMPFTSQCGFDVYSREKETETWKYHLSCRPNYIDTRKYIASPGLFRTKKEREIILNFPLYSGVVSLEIGLEKGAKVKANPFHNPKRIVCYGTSILQGGCVSRPGLCVTNALSRHFNQEVLNYGFSGAGLLEKEVAKIIASRENVELLTIDAEPNAGCDHWMSDNLEIFLEEIYKAYPDLPIVVMGKTRMGIDDILPRNHRVNAFNDLFQRSVVENFHKKGKNIHFLENYHIFDNDVLDSTEYTVDGVHPTDLGMSKLINQYIKAITELKKEAR